jgi:phospholipid-binding lipoprotein MlaA
MIPASSDPLARARPLSASLLVILALAVAGAAPLPVRAQETTSAASAAAPAAAAAVAAPAAAAGEAPADSLTESNSIYDEEPVVPNVEQIPDRVEGLNRAIFKFNDGVYRFVLRPISKGYARVVPAPVRRGISSFFHNLGFPTRFAGNVLEGKIHDAGVETGRFVVNSVTSLGFVATADRIPALQEKPSDLGQAFGTWGIGHGTYLILPVLGPSSLRDGVGYGLSAAYLDPIDYLDEWETRTGARVVNIVNESPELMDRYDQLKQAALDPYVALRDAYSARRSKRDRRKPLPVVPAASESTQKPK